MTERTHRAATRGDLLFAVGAMLLIVVLWQIRGVVLMAAFAVLFAYMLAPVVGLLERIPFPRGRRMPRKLSSVIAVLLAVGVLATLTAFAVPMLVAQIAAFVQQLPEQTERLVDWIRAQAVSSGQSAGVESTIEQVRSTVRTMLPNLAAAAARWTGRLFAQFTEIITLLVLPVLTFYLLTDQRRVRESLLSFMPEEMRDSVNSSTGPLHRAMQSYVRGQALVCLVQGVATGAMLGMANIPNAMLLGVLAGLGEILPFIGAIFASVAIALSGISVSPTHALIGLGIYLVNNWLLQTFVTPRVMERYLKIHPFVVIVSVLAGSQLLGPAGALLALPATAVAQAIIQEAATRRRRERTERDLKQV
jgi:predicted PurR-regulated permease PerM